MASKDKAVVRLVGWSFAGLAACTTASGTASSGAGDTPPARASTEQRAHTPEDAHVHGRLQTVDGVPVLTVWGTPQQMGYAHGFLLRDRIVEIVEGYALEAVGPATLETVAPVVAETAAIPEALRVEAAAIVTGMEAAGGAHIPKLGRSLTGDDLLVLNAITDLMAVGCSSVSAWGTATADDPDLSGQAAVVRNLDWSDDPDLLRNQIVIAWHPSDPKRQPVVSVAFAGYIGCLSCMNAAGVTALFNMGYGDGAFALTGALRGFAPANLLLRDALERIDPDGDERSSADDVENVVREADHAGSYIVHVLEPTEVAAASDRAPARILEVEADGVVTRHPQAHDELGATMLAATNHLRAKDEPRSCRRYAKIERTARLRRHRFDTDQLWNLGRRVRLDDVVHQILIEPDTRIMSVWLRNPTDAATARIRPARLHWTDVEAIFAQFAATPAPYGR